MILGYTLTNIPQKFNTDKTNKQKNVHQIVSRNRRRTLHNDSHEVEPPPKEDEGLYIPSYLEEAILDDPVLQVKVAFTLRVQEMNSRRCFTCNRPGHFTQDHQEWEEKNGIRPLQSKGPTPNQAASEKARQKPSQLRWPGPPTE